MVLLALLLVPFIFGILSFFSGKASKNIALGASILNLIIAAALSLEVYQGATIQFSIPWISTLGTQLSLYADGLATMLCLLTAVLYPILLLVNRKKDIEASAAYYALILLSQVGLMGVFLAADVMLFYFSWELALVPIYFLCSKWGAEKRIPVTFKFFVYTFVGSLMMLAALIYLSMQNNGANAMSLTLVIAAGKALPFAQQQVIFILLFLAFAIKMPMFPLHTWQPDAYEQAPTQITIILSAIMPKMGLYGVIRWLAPICPEAFSYWADTIMALAIFGIVYASLIALVQNNIKKLIAYSSIAHMGLMCAVAFSGTSIGTQGLMVQMFNHGINITAMWVLVVLIEDRYNTLDLKQMGGLATYVPGIAIALVVVAFANIALPLTNGFVGEFMLFTGLFQSASAYHVGFMVLAGLGVILGAAYTLNMVQKVAYGSNRSTITEFKALSVSENIALVVLILFIIILGVFPQPLIDLVNVVLV